ncbi:sugar kinase [Neobacillus sp. GCM10023253]|uniref:sugar kinase n=1 Tax=Neobacillus sp. GCM10023253 TaxID=3252644 RepID=UPI0036154F2D
MDVITFGETMVLLNPSKAGPLRYVSKFEKTIGGAESNVAIALARLGHRVSWASRLGEDEFGLYIRNFIRGEGVDTSLVTFDPASPTGVFFKERQDGRDPKVNYFRAGSAASRMGKAHLQESEIAKAKILHISGITPALSSSCRELVYHAIDAAKRNKVTIVFDPNIRLKLWTKEEAREVLIDIAGKCDIVLPGIEEGLILTGEKTPEKIAEGLIKNGSKAVVVKLGDTGAYYNDGDKQEYVDGYRVEKVVDTVGAGDGFAAGFISGLLRGWSYRNAVSLGNRVGASAVTVAGDVEGYPYWAEIAPDRSEEILR